MCCSLKTSDLFVLYNTSHMLNLTRKCSDRRQCIFAAPRTTRIVNGGTKKISSYSVVHYSCFAETTNEAPAASGYNVGAIVGSVIAVIVVAALVVVAGFFWYRRRQKDRTEPRSDRQVPAISKPTEPYMINGIYVQNTETDDYARIDENKLNETAAVVSPYETASADEFAKGGKDDQDRETEEGYTLAKDVPDVRASPGEVSASADEFAKGGKDDQDRETEEGYTLAKDVPDVRASPGEESGKGQNRIAVDAGEEDQYNRITFQPAEVRPQPNYSHVVGSGKQENEDPDYDHFDTNTGHGRNYIIDDYDVTHI
ncbi:uncharacterized protein LOC121372157 [Gigantopelta aegis]|uniref:uncharacterized protein LOC121372157 n=1 Tax=Gigantopelta aegis TaxID=1735272 RepID=UPI001B88E112|nr:uncharacterized protein LOC121372157 [Gigantopelta aegis]